MGEKGTKICLITFNVVCMMCGIAMFVGGLLLQLNPTVKNILSSVATTASQTQLGIVAVVLIALGAFVTFIAFVGCCGAVSESRCMLTMYFLSLLILLLAQIGIAIAALVYGSQGFSTAINIQLGILVRGYGPDPTSAAIVDTIQQTFACCGYTGPEDYKNYDPATPTTGPVVTTAAPSDNQTVPTTVAVPAATTTVTVPATVQPDPTAMSNSTDMNATTATMPGTVAPPMFLNGTWPDSCCVRVNDVYKNLTQCKNNKLPTTELKNYLNMKGCTASIDEFTKQYMIIIGAVGLGIALIEIIAMIAACSLRKALD
ncbi:CD63 antigen [Ciona intestinalis]